jgi:hypothetical protein
MSEFSIKDLKRNRKSSFEHLNKKIDDMRSSYARDPDSEFFWQPEVDKAGNGYAIIRFLPAAPGEDTPFVRIFSHGFKGPGGWYIENSRTTLNDKDPVSEYNTVLWNSTSDDESPARKQVRDQKRKLNYISNVLVVKDSANPANEGKVFLYKYGKKIWDKIMAAMHPEYEDETPVNPFDMWEGANFKLKIRKIGGYRNYDQSQFDAPEAISGTDAELEAIWKQCRSLEEQIHPSKFKSYEELKSRLDKVLGTNTSSPNAGMDEDEIPSEEYRPKQKATPAKKIAAKAEEKEELPWTDTNEDEDMDFFKRLADEG